MSMPCLHAPVVATKVPSMSMIAWSKKASGCWDQTPMRTSSKMSWSVSTSAGVKRRQKSPAGGGSGVRRGAQGGGEELSVWGGGGGVQKQAAPKEVWGEGWVGGGPRGEESA